MSVTCDSVGRRYCLRCGDTLPGPIAPRDTDRTSSVACDYCHDALLGPSSCVCPDDPPMCTGIPGEDVAGIGEACPHCLAGRPCAQEDEDQRPDAYDRDRPGPITCTCQLDPGACPDHEDDDERDQP